MPDIKIYLDADLHAAVKQHKLPVSQICQGALKRHLRLEARRASGELPSKHGHPKGRQ